MCLLAEMGEEGKRVMITQGDLAYTVKLRGYEPPGKTDSEATVIKNVHPITNPQTFYRNIFPEKNNK